MERSTWPRWAPPTISQAIRAYRRAISAPTGYDYAVDVLGDATGARYIGDYRHHGAILMPHRPVLIAIDIVRLGFGSA